MKASHPFIRRLVVLGIFWVAIPALFALVMYNTQILHGEEFRAKSLSSNAASEVVEASRGIVTDRNGKELISNRPTYTLRFSGDSFDDDTALNAAIWRLVQLCQENNVVWNDSLPLTQTLPIALQDKTFDESFVMWAEDKDLPGSDKEEFSLDLTAQELMDHLTALYGLGTGYTAQQARLITGIRYELDVHDLLGSYYTFADDVTVELISQVKDGRFEGVTTGTASARVYNTTYAAHILGRIGPIYHEEWVGNEDSGIVG